MNVTGTLVRNTTSLVSENSSSFSAQPGIFFRGWSTNALIPLVLFLLTLVANIPVLCMLLTVKPRSPFTIYLINLLINDIVASCLDQSLGTLSALYSWTYLGKSACALKLYGRAFFAGSMASHVLITVNRLWAVYKPMVYRSHHNERVALSLCAVQWTCSQLLYLPALLVNVFRYPDAMTNGSCTYHRIHLMGWQTTTNVFVFYVPTFFVIGGYFFVMRKVNESRKRAGLHGRSSNTNTEQSGDAQKAEKNAERSAYLTFHLMTVCCIIFWSPVMIYQWIVQATGSGNPVVGLTLGTFSAFQAVVDPVLFISGMRDLRRKALNIIPCKKLSFLGYERSSVTPRRALELTPKEVF